MSRATAAAVSRPAPSRRVAAARTAAVAVVYLVVWTALDVASTRLEVAQGVSLWYPPPGLDVALLLVLGVRWWPLLVVSCVLHVSVVAPGMAPASAVVCTVVTTGGWTGAAVVLRRALPIDPRLPSLRDVVRLLWVAAGAAALLVCTARVLLMGAAGMADAPAPDLVLALASSWAGSATGIAMLTPLLLVAARRWSPAGGWPTTWTRLPPLARPGPGPGRVETLAQAATLLGGTWLAYGGAPGASLDYTYLVYAPLLWVAARGGLVRVAPAVLVVNAVAVLMAGRTVREGSIGATSAAGGFALQFGLVTLSVAGLLMGALVTQRRAEAEVHHQAALHDALTGLANRALLDERLARALARTRDDPAHRVGVLFCDLDGFKAVNDSLGHAAGDQVLVETARRLRAAVGPDHSVARLGGDEFAVVLDGVEEGGVAAAAGRVTAALAAPHRLDPTHDRVVVTVSLGSAQADGMGAGRGAGPPDGAELLRDADVALHRAKGAGRNRHVAFERAMHARALGRLSTESALRRALDEQRITVAYQPVVDLRDGSVVAAEALARWQPAGGDPVPATTFTALAEETGLIADLGAQVHRLAVADAARWSGRAGPSPRLALNVSAAELGGAGFGERLLEVLERAGLEPSRLDVEITETVLVEQDEATTASLRALADAGAGVVVDDFGTGFSSFSYLRSMPITGLKIDASFVAGLPDQRRDAAIVRAILAMAAELDLEIVAEGVSTRAQLGFLREHRCALGQGFLLGRPGGPGELVGAGRGPWPPREEPGGA